jgi:hypothetical protein
MGAVCDIPPPRAIITNQKGIIMRLLMNVTLPTQTFNAAVKDGTVGAKLNKILAAIKPEAVYFTEHGGKRGAVLIVNLPDAAKIPVLAEPWFLVFQAEVEFRIAMTPEDLQHSGIDGMGQAWG